MYGTPLRLVLRNIQKVVFTIYFKLLSLKKSY